MIGSNSPFVAIGTKCGNDCNPPVFTKKILMDGSLIGVKDLAMTDTEGYLHTVGQSRNVTIWVG